VGKSEDTSGGILFALPYIFIIVICIAVLFGILQICPTTYYPDCQDKTAWYCITIGEQEYQYYLPVILNSSSIKPAAQHTIVPLSKSGTALLQELLHEIGLEKIK